MADVRLIVQSSANGEDEYVVFSNGPQGTPVEDFIIDDCSIDIDTIIDIDLPSGFPMNYTLQRTGL